MIGEMRHDLPADEIDAFLARPLLAVLSTLRPDGSVLLSPIWHEWRDGGFELVLGRDDVKARHLQRDPRATLVVCEHEPPYAGVEVRGVAVLSDEDGSALDERLAERYLGAVRARAYLEANTWPSVVVRLEPGALRSWDFSDDASLA